MPTQTRAAIIREAPGNFEIVDIELDDPRQGEIRVKMVAAGLCHSDLHLATGDSKAGHLPIVGGHEGSGIVEEVGPDTPGWEVGDHVVFSFIPSCGKCRWCSEGMTSLCDLGKYLLSGNRFDDENSFRFSLPDGTAVGQMCAVGSFAERTVVHVDSAVKLPKEAPLDVVWLLGCGVGTGWGSTVYAAETRPGDVIVVAGIGGVGINAVQGADNVGAATIIAVDPVEFKREKALEFGATHAFATVQEAADFARSITNGQGADRFVITVGVVSGQDVADGVSAIRKGGVCVVTGITPDAETGIPVSPLELTRFQKRIQGAIFGAGNPRPDIARQYGLYQAGKLKLDELITRTYPFEDLTKGYDDLLAGINIRGGVHFS